jgi:hypothetical protein
MNASVKKIATSVVFVAAMSGGMIASKALMAPSQASIDAALDASLKAVAERMNAENTGESSTGVSFMAAKAGVKEIQLTYSVSVEAESDVRFGGFEADERLRQLVCTDDGKALVRNGAQFRFSFMTDAKHELIRDVAIGYCL